MIQTTAPTLNAGLAQGPTSAPVPGLASAGFAALLETTQAPATATVEPALHTGGAMATVPMALGEVVKGTQDGLAALARQAGAALSAPAAQALPGSGTPVVPAVVEVPATAAFQPGNPVLSATSQLALTVAFLPQVPTQATPVAVPVAPLDLAPTGFAQAGPAAPMVQATTSPKSSLPVTSAPLAKTPAPVAVIVGTAPTVDTPGKVLAGGKDGKTGGKILPSDAAPIPTDEELAAKVEPAVVSAVIAPVTANAPAIAPSPIAVAGTALDIDTAPAPVGPEQSATRTSVPFATARFVPTGPAGTVRAAPRLPASVVGHAAASPQPALAVAPQVDAVRLEPITIVAADAPLAAPTAETAAKTAQAEPATPASAAATKAAPALVQAPVVETVPSAPVASPAATQAHPRQSETVRADASVPQQASAAEPAHQPENRTAPTMAAPARPELRAQPDANLAANVAQPETGLRAEPRANLATRADRTAQPAQVEGHTAAQPAEPETSPAATRAATLQPAVQSLLADATPVPVAADGVPSPAAAPVEGPQDFATLVSRLAEAREAASPHVVRTALEHGEFGRVSMQLSHTDDGLSVTLASRDPEFTSAVQAAAATLASNASGHGEQPRQDGSGQNPNAQGQANSSPAQAGAGNGQQARADASGQQSRREGGTFGQSQSGSQDRPQQQGTPGRGRSASRPDGDVYA